ncbi:hypothetical protein FVEG_16255 [Fusarium verticillioides 7600]|uniref:Uncharacterized protein n=1 Tax=Gibberella moniliformis (strain M3125 / FGSC 7600) TaxID=334819 RepID=W7ML81_GIBM7|nr:hypothetical protein FVEG_16255 [Fusarium verticillioides 7600]EWG48310.1 hypothetical protein FVEG_16255 [Fusarium verticillioides 7600]
MELLIADRGALLQTMHVGGLILHLQYAYAGSDYSISSITRYPSTHSSMPSLHVGQFTLCGKKNARDMAKICTDRSTAVLAVTVEAGSRSRRRGSCGIDPGSCCAMSRLW